MLQIRKSVDSIPPISIPAGDIIKRMAPRRRSSPGSMASLITVPPDTRIFRPGSQVDRIFVHVSGTAVLCEEAGSFAASFTKPVTPGAAYGVIELLAGKNFCDEFRTVSECKIYVIDRRRFLALLRRDPEICFSLATTLAKHFEEVVRNIKGA